MCQNKAFTLIELLVVVLIIGILAAVALPQYKVAVAKSRIIPWLNVGKSIINAQESYYLANGEYTSNIENLDVNFSGCTMAITNGKKHGNDWKCGNDIFMDFSRHDDNRARGVLMVEYCPGYNGSYNTCAPKRDFVIHMNFLRSSEKGFYWGSAGEITCEVFNNSSFGKKVCKALEGQVDHIERV